jgi:hypothetical protein
MAQSTLLNFGRESRRELLLKLSRIQEKLARFDIRNAADYAEVLISEAVQGTRHPSGVNKGFDVTSPLYGRIEVKCRQLPRDGRPEERVEVSKAKHQGFDYLAIVIFHLDFSVKGALVTPYEGIWRITSRHKYNRLSYSQAVSIAGSVDLTSAVIRASLRELHS